MFGDINWTIVVLGPLVGLLGMFAGGYWGIGCGWLVVPSMLIMGLTPMEAVGIGLLQMVPSVLPTAIKTTPAIGWGRRSLGNALVLPLAAGAFLASFSGAPINRFAYRLCGDSGLLILFMVVMAVIGLQTVLGSTAFSSGQPRTYTGRESFWAFVGGLGAGVFSSVLGIGGAVLMRPMLAGGFRVPERETANAVRLLLLVTTLCGGLTYVVHQGNVAYRVVWISLLVAAGGMIGFPCGVRLHEVVVRQGYAQHVHKSFASIAAVIVFCTLLKLCGQIILSRCLLLLFAVLLAVYLLWFGAYARKHPLGGAAAHVAGNARTCSLKERS